jgi:hypothetical protein
MNVSRPLILNYLLVNLLRKLITPPRPCSYHASRRSAVTLFVLSFQPYAHICAERMVFSVQSTPSWPRLICVSFFTSLLDVQLQQLRLNSKRKLNESLFLFITVQDECSLIQRPRRPVFESMGSFLININFASCIVFRDRINGSRLYCQNPIHGQSFRSVRLAV